MQEGAERPAEREEEKKRAAQARERTRDGVQAHQERFMEKTQAREGEGGRLISREVLMGSRQLMSRTRESCTERTHTRTKSSEHKKEQATKGTVEKVANGKKRRKKTQNVTLLRECGWCRMEAERRLTNKEFNEPSLGFSCGSPAGVHRRSFFFQSVFPLHVF